MEQVVMAVTATEFGRVTGLPTYSISRYKKEFQWANQTDGLKPKILLTEENKRIAAELCNTRPKRKSVYRTGRPKKNPDHAHF